MKTLIDIFFSVKEERRTRGHEVTEDIVQDQSRLYVRKY